MSRQLLLALLACVGTAGVIAACDLNPQPLPPESFATPTSEDDDASTPRGDASDLGSVPVDGDASAPDAGANNDDAGDAGDGGDGGDASDDAEAGATAAD